MVTSGSQIKALNAFSRSRSIAASTTSSCSDEILEIREISVEERIIREQGDLLEMVKREYLYRRCGNMPIREYNKVSREMENNPELQYLALKEFNTKQRLTKRLSRQKGFKDMTMAEFNEKINQLIDAKDEEEFNRILKSIQK